MTNSNVHIVFNFPLNQRHFGNGLPLVICTVKRRMTIEFQERMLLSKREWTFKCRFTPSIMIPNFIQTQGNSTPIDFPVMKKANVIRWRGCHLATDHATGRFIRLFLPDISIQLTLIHSISLSLSFALFQ